MKFTELNLHEKLMQGITEAEFSECTPVQEQTFSKTFDEKDVIVQSQTGTGKTAAFLISVFQILANRQDEKKNRVLIVAPTRELVVQIEEEAKLLGKHLPFTFGVFFGGMGYQQQEKSLKDGVDVLIGTPGRLLDFIDSKKILLDDIEMVVIDEADRLFDMGFYPDIKKMMKKMPAPDKRQTLLFSATISTRVMNLAWEFMNEPAEIKIEPESITVNEIDQQLFHVSRDEKFKLLLGLMKKESPQNTVIFTNTKNMAVELTKRLRVNGYQCQYIMGDLPQKKRLQIIENMKDGSLPILIATDVAARGLHINDLEMVVNYDIPEDFENYVHRIGRTARAGKSGKAISLACEKYVYGLTGIEDYIGMKIPVEWYDEALLAEDKSADMRFSDYRHGNRGGRQDSRQGGGRSQRSGGQGRKRHGQSDRDRDRDNRQRTGGSRGSGQDRRNSAPQHQKKSASSAGNRDKTQNRGQNRDRNRNQGRNRQDSGYNKNRGQKRGPDKHHAGRTHKQGPQDKISNKNSIDDRIAYYKKKYGEDFQVDKKTLQATETKPQKKGVKGFFKRLFKK